MLRVDVYEGRRLVLNLVLMRETRSAVDAIDLTNQRGKGEALSFNAQQSRLMRGEEGRELLQRPDAGWKSASSGGC